VEKMGREKKFGGRARSSELHPVALKRSLSKSLRNEEEVESPGAASFVEEEAYPFIC